MFFFNFVNLCNSVGKFPSAVAEEVAMAIGGWSDFSTMRKIYTHISQTDMAAKTEKFAAFFSENAKQNANDIKKASVLNGFAE